MKPTVAALERWNATLRLFRFEHAVGGHANDGDELRATLAFAGEDALVALFVRLERPLAIAARSPIRAYPRYETPRRTTLFGVSVFVTVETDAVELALAGGEGDPYSVTERDFQAAVTLERALQERGLLP